LVPLPRSKQGDFGMKKTRLSYSSVTTYLECGEKYRLGSVEKLRPTQGRSALLFGTAIDEALNTLLETKDITKAKEVFNQNWSIGKINYLDVPLRDSDIVTYSKADFDEDLGKTPWDSLHAKGILFLDAYEKEVLPKIKKVIVVQKTNEIENSDGDKIVIKLDLIVEWEDGKIYLLDNKTTSVKYDQKSAEEAPQLLLYYNVEKDNYGLDGVGYITIDKNIRKTKKMHCQSCKLDYANNRLKNCPDCKTVLAHIDTDFSVNINYFLNSNPKAEIVDKVLEDFDWANYGITNDIFNKNEQSCFSKFGKCEFYDICKHGSMKGLVSLKK
jgi:hypothetical protein